jgi:hypothetical protein
LDGASGRGGEALTPIRATGAARPATKAAQRVERGDGLRARRAGPLDAWDRHSDRRGDDSEELAAAVAVLRTTLAASAPASQPIHRAGSRPNTKQAQVLAMLRRNEGASGPQIAEATGWAPHTVRGFLANLAKKGVRVEALNRIRQIGPNKAGAKGGYTVYRVSAEVGE